MIKQRYNNRVFVGFFARLSLSDINNMDVDTYNNYLEGCSNLAQSLFGGKKEKDNIEEILIEDF